MTVDDVIAEGPKLVVDDVVALAEFDLKKKTAPASKTHLILN